MWLICWKCVGLNRAALALRTPKFVEVNESILMSIGMPLRTKPICLQGMATSVTRLLIRTILSRGSLEWATKPGVVSLRSKIAPFPGERKDWSFSVNFASLLCTSDLNRCLLRSRTTTFLRSLLRLSGRVSWSVHDVFGRQMRQWVDVRRQEVLSIVF